MEKEEIRSKLTELLEQKANKERERSERIAKYESKDSMQKSVRKPRAKKEKDQSSPIERQAMDTKKLDQLKQGHIWPTN